MMQPSILIAMIAYLCVSVTLPIHCRAAANDNGNIEPVVANVVQSLMARYGVPGMAVGIVMKGQSIVVDYGVASKTTLRPVTDKTLFEIGSVSKTFTATLAAYARISGALSLSDPASKYLPILRGSAFDTVTLLHLGTHTPGGLPLQVPDDITNDMQLMAYFRNGKPVYAPGTYRTYANPSIGMLGMIVAKSMNGDFVSVMQSTLFRGLGMKNTYLDVPRAEDENYAQGYTTTDVPA